MENLTIVVPFWNGHNTIRRLMNSLPPDIPAIIVDDMSDEPLTMAHINRKNTRIVRLRNKGFFSGAVNAGAAECRGDFLILNQDTWFEGGQWQRVLSKRNRRRYATIGHGVMKHRSWKAGYVQGTFMFVRRDAWNKVGGFNERDYPLWGSTCEWQLRVCRAGYGALPLYKKKILGFRHDEHRRAERRNYGSAITEMLRRHDVDRDKMLDTPPMVSIVVPCYNYGRFLNDAINSLIGGETCLGQMDGQTFQSFEVVIVDDASTDDSWQIAQSLVNPQKGIRAIRQSKNGGCPATLNRGIREAHGQYIHILSADDMRESWSIEQMVRTLQDNPHSIPYGDITIVTGGQRARTLKLPDYDFEKVLKKNPMPAGIMYPVEAWKEVGGYPEVMRHGREDWAFNIALGMHGWCGIHTGHSGNLYRRDRQNRSLQTSNIHKGEVAPTGSRDWRAFFRQQLQELYPGIYEGERMGSCCGGGRPMGKAGQGAKGKAQNLPGRKGMVVLEYVGSNDGKQTFWGDVTATQYRFGGSRKRGYVAVADVPGLLSLTKRKRKLFLRAASPKPKPKPKRKPKPKAAKPSPAYAPAEVKVVEADSIHDDGDDLTIITGVGPALAQKLSTAGYNTIEILAMAVPAKLAEIKGLSSNKAAAVIYAAEAVAEQAVTSAAP